MKEYHRAGLARRKLCVVKGCGKYQHAKGLCGKHNLRLVKYGRVDALTQRDPQEIRVEGGCAYIVFRDNKGNNAYEAIVDAEDVPRISCYRWSYSGKGAVQGNRGAGTSVILSRLLVNAPPGKLVTHLNHDPLDNRKANLRIAPPGKEIINANLSRKSKSGTPGVRWDSMTRCWNVRLTCGDKEYWGGCFRCFRKAVATRLKLEKEHFAGLSMGCANDGRRLAERISDDSDLAEPELPADVNRCTHCGEVKPLADFRKNANRKREATAWCKPCAQAKETRRKAAFVGCSVPKCRQKHFDKGLCLRHYKNLVREKTGLVRTKFDLNEIRVEGREAYISLYNKKCKKIAEAIIDAEDVPKVDKCKWSYGRHSVYAERHDKRGKRIALTHAIMGKPPEGKIYNHINKNPHDCRKANLILFKHIEQTINCRLAKNNRSGVRGVWWYEKYGKWRALLRRNGKNYFGGYHAELADAINARRRLEDIYFRGLIRLDKRKPT